MVRRFWPKTIIIMRPATCRDDSRRLPAEFVLYPTGRKRHPLPAVPVSSEHLRRCSVVIFHYCHSFLAGISSAAVNGVEGHSLAVAAARCRDVGDAVGIAVYCQPPCSHVDERHGIAVEGNLLGVDHVVVVAVDEQHNELAVAERVYLYAVRNGQCVADDYRLITMDSRRQQVQTVPCSNGSSP